MNPEESTTLEDNMTTHTRNSRITILQKKLQFKQQECDQLWLDYEDALRRISQLENEGGEKIGRNDLLSEIDTEEMQGRIKYLQQNMRVL